MPTFETERDDWSIHIRTDVGPEPRIEVSSEHIIRGQNGHRMVMQKLPQLTSTLVDIDQIPAALPDGRVTTLGDLVSALRRSLSAAIDQCEQDIDGVTEKPAVADLHIAICKSPTA